jgi:amino acid adenylation domain-containing protein
MASSQPGTSVSGAAFSGAYRGSEFFQVEALDNTITRRFAASTKASRSSVALVQDGEALTYADLDLRSNQLARFLRRQGVGANSRLALHASPSIAALIAILAALKAGAAYVPLDPTAPQAYLNWVLHDCGAGLVLSGARHDGELPVPTMDLAKALAASAEESTAALDDDSRPDDIAYVMYTSGSTGRPKGVQVPHRAVVRLVTDQTYARFAADEVILHASALAFDASTFEIWGTLLHGARGVVVRDERASLQRIAEAINRNGVTTAWFTSGLFNLFVDHQLGALQGLRQILAGGDVLSPSHVLRAQAALPDCQLINGYGPTENTTFTCCYRIPREGWDGGPVPIGTPIRGTYVRLLDEDMNPVADGEIGMLYAGGLGLAAGYLGDARQSAADFVTDPMRPEDMLYRTGDLARRRPDGNLDFIGRRDRQVKIDGKRVELGEIEEALRKSTGVSDAVVTMGQAGEPSLTGYLKPVSGECDRAALVSRARATLIGTLPPHMRPSRVIVVDAFPLTSNGKIDLDRLPAPRQPETSTAALAKGEAERTLTGIFSRVLGLGTIGLDTNFFDLGATSLKLIEAHASIERVWPGVGVIDLFQHPSIRGLARAIEGPTTPAESPTQSRARQQSEALKRLQRAKTAR